MAAKGSCVSPGGPYSLGFSTRSRPPTLAFVLLVPAAAFSGQAQAVIMTGPLKTEGMLASTVSQSNVVLTPAAIARVRDGPQHHNPRVALLLGSPPLT